MNEENQKPSDEHELKGEQTVFKEEKVKTSSGLDENIAGLLCYVGGLVTGIIFLVLEKDSKFVRFHAMQSIFVTVAMIVLSMILGFIPVIGWLLSLFLSPLGFVLWIILMLKAYQGKLFKLPIVGDLAEKQVEQS